VATGDLPALALDRIRLLRELAGLIGATRDVAFTATVSQSDYDSFAAISGNQPRMAGSPYTLALVTCIDAARDYLEAEYPNDHVYYWFESGTKNEKEAKEFVRRLDEHPSGKQFFRMRGYSFIPKKDALALCAADFLAWEWQRNYSDAHKDEDYGVKDGQWSDNFKLLFKDATSKPIRSSPLSLHRLQIRAMINGIYGFHRD
jgi:hypothetical protein